MEIKVGPDIQMPGHNVLERKPVRINGYIVGFLYTTGDVLELLADRAGELLNIVRVIAKDTDVMTATAAFKNVRFVTMISE